MGDIVIGVARNSETRHREPPVFLVEIAPASQRIVWNSYCIECVGNIAAHAPGVANENEDLSGWHPRGGEIAARFSDSPGLQLGPLESPSQHTPLDGRSSIDVERAKSFRYPIRQGKRRDEARGCTDYGGSPTKAIANGARRRCVCRSEILNADRRRKSEGVDALIVVAGHECNDAALDHPIYEL